jgi:tetratricopeptide (TPR) repeat protein
LSLNPSEVRAWVVLGRVHIYYQQYERAKTEMDRAIAINPSDADGLAGRGNILVWHGETDAGIEALEQAQRIDPEPNPFDRNALALAYYLKGHHESAVQQAQLNLPEPLGAHFGHALLAAAYAQQGRLDEAAAAAALLRRMDPMFDPEAFGSKLQNGSDLERLRDGLRKAGLYTPAPDQR